jgi:hypothetical protein
MFNLPRYNLANNLLNTVAVFTYQFNRANRYGLDGPAIENHTAPDRPRGTTSSIRNGYLVIKEGKAAEA